MECGICRTVIDVESPATTLLCNHKFHTRCIITEIYRFIGPNRPITHSVCSECGAHIIPNDIIEIIHGEDRDAEIENRTIKFMWETEPKFKNQLKAFKDSYVKAKKNKNAMNKASKTIIAEFKEAIAPAKRFIEHAIKVSKEKLHALAEYKNYTSAMSGYTLTKNNIFRIWGVKLWSIRDALRNMPDAMTLIPPNMYLFNSTKHMFRVRLH
jgi:hypothetical protein